jgi:3-hydroxyisobutyrate dehydrogenase-like beta-hydroxyacid dehydrogenase
MSVVNYGFIGLGHQGTPMAERMIAAGLKPWLWARRSEVLERYRGTQARIATTPAQLGAHCDVVGLCLYDAAATEDVLFGPDGLMEGVRPGTVVAVHATVGPNYVKELVGRVAGAGVSVVDAPVSGGDEAAAGRLLVMAGGSEVARARCAEMFATYAGRIVVLGDVGAAQSAKLVNNSLMTAITGLVFDAFEFGSALGVDRTGLGEVLANGSAATPSVEVCLALGEDEFSLRAWPTLHKDVALAVTMSTGPSQLLDVAAATITDMERRRAAMGR